ncbi:pimeloyl-ACP methyl ester carboxylesterase [Filimonas zeae]|uniref:AB hydrolase-1 domain-containing protein n=1 Tax=Filimonas zeae TaxID=1737353 RepID=A0A917MYJ3_9BACT|nr:alpha/beta hydrolase [Filimonas zeae]MDR6342093.1 pimeloyl-ACP methyl ester carboxylesterase [Filimonas zeae]GGH79134.1 hypothetical protein GCM10011379_48040 [Filimonas zeae]
MPVITINGRAVHYQQLNEQATDTVLLVHGMFSNLAVYYFHIAPILAQHFRVVMYDMKGHGMSDRAESGYHLEAMAADMQALMQVLRLPAVHLAGYSFGALVALKAALEYPQRIRRLGLIEGPDPADKRMLEGIAQYNRDMLLDYVEKNDSQVLTTGGRRRLEKMHRRFEYLFHETTIRNDMEKEHAFFEDAAIRALPHDTLLMYGRSSDCVGAGELLHNRISRSNLVLIEGDHTVPVQQPAVIGERLTTFFNN